MATLLSRSLLPALLLVSVNVVANPVAPFAAEPGMTVTPSGARISSRVLKDAEAAHAAAIAAGPVKPAVTVPEFTSGRPVIALASAIGGQLSHVIARETTGTNLDPYTRTTLLMPDNSLDVLVLRGLDRVVARNTPESERIFMRLNPVLLDDVAPPEREAVALKRLVAEISRWPQRQQWDRIIVVTPHYRGFERGGLGSRLHGVGVYVQNLDNSSEFNVIEPDGRAGKERRNRYVALYYYASMFVIDAKSLRVLDHQPWLIDQKIYDSETEALDVANMLPTKVLAQRMEAFAETASRTALTRTLSGRVEPGEPREVTAPATAPAR